MDKPAPPDDAEGLLLQQYPSPAADGQGIAGYYDDSGSLAVHHLQLDAPLPPPATTAMDSPQLKNEAPLSPAAGESRPSVGGDDSDELQLAARLSDSLAPMMAAAAAAQEAAAMAGHDRSHEPLLPHDAPNPTTQVSAETVAVANHDHENHAIHNHEGPPHIDVIDQAQPELRGPVPDAETLVNENNVSVSDNRASSPEDSMPMTENHEQPTEMHNGPVANHVESTESDQHPETQDVQMDGSDLANDGTSLHSQAPTMDHHGLPLSPEGGRGLDHHDQNLQSGLPNPYVSPGPQPPLQELHHPAPVSESVQQRQQQQPHPPPPPPPAAHQSQHFPQQQTQQPLAQQPLAQQPLVQQPPQQPPRQHPLQPPRPLPQAQQPGPHYDPVQQPQMQLPPHLQMAYGGAPHDNGIPPRKRSKVSRACDACRRKKVKCDSISETGEVACTNCRRSQIRCDFSRIPQKRGPSKGYIKELADRINSIEGKLGNQALAGEFMEQLAGAPRRESSDTFSPSPSAPLNENAKRPFSSMSAEATTFNTPVSSKSAAAANWPTEPRPIHPYPAPATPGQKPPYSVNNLAPRLVPAPAPAPAPAPVLEAQTPSRPPPIHVETPAPAVADTRASIDAIPNGTCRDIDDNVFHGYLTIVHPTFPLLASVKTVVQSNLGQCPPVLQKAFHEALVSTMHSFHAMPAGVAAGDAKAANRLLSEWESNGGSQGSSMADLVHLQSLLLLAIEADNHGPAALRGQHGSPSKTSYLGRAVAVAYAMGLRTAQVMEDGWPEPDSDPESEDMVALRAWWSLVALDRFNAVGTAQGLLVPQGSIHVGPGLRNLLGEAGYQFVKLCFVLGHYVEAFLTSARPLTMVPGASQLVLSQSLAVGIEMWRMDFPASITPKSHPVLHFAYWHCRLLSYLFTPSSQSTELLWAAKGLLDDLTASHVALSPLNHNVVALAGLCLAELARVPKTREEARDLMANELMGGNTAPSTWDNVIREKMAAMEAGASRPASSASASTSIEATASQSLKRLADLAAATKTGLAATASAAAAIMNSGGNGKSENAVSNGDGSGGAPEVEAAAPDGYSAGRDRTLPGRLRGPAENYENLGFDPRPMLRSGYLNALGGA
ncbi:hypothetical protein GGTG_07708 [Gaeumannomyces tritici R3-111a-1]|uniref:Zn(2)-C6 fungal-type domain-containing protein n=1 Tax=Gaeumannomyces tritici (strain R3-111a-1) TaxID=644352 RepID=J3P2G1_GAET3|nr:hypothetical protein GGTG_07708 [Gaeumannomyces tritici R3-111a-1]EJT73853.1 hypothetical protein GGTG_07708 [Gaeumannomyces tritici R3-111a-1]